MYSICDAILKKEDIVASIDFSGDYFKFEIHTIPEVFPVTDEVVVIEELSSVLTNAMISGGYKNSRIFNVVFKNVMTTEIITIVVSLSPLKLEEVDSNNLMAWSYFSFKTDNQTIESDTKNIVLFEKFLTQKQRNA